jgi:hypothetical protein
VISIVAVALAVTASAASALPILSVPPPPSLPAFTGHAFNGKPARHSSNNNYAGIAIGPDGSATSA